MFTRYIVALCLAKLCAVQTMAQSREQTKNLRVADYDISSIEQTWMDLKSFENSGYIANHSSWKDAINDRIESSNEHTINKEPMSLVALTPKPVLDAIASVRKKIETDLYGVLEDALEKTGAKDLIDDALASVNTIVGTLKKSVTGLFSLTAGEILLLGKTLDTMFKNRTAALYQHLDGKCVKESSSFADESMRMRRLFQMTDRTLLDDYVPPNDAMSKEMDETLEHLGTSMGNSIKNEGKSEYIRCNNGTMRSIKTDNGALSVNVKGLMGAKFQTQSGIYLESLIDIGVDAGVTIPQGDLRLSGNAGLLISFGKEDISNLNETQSSNQTERLIKTVTTNKSTGNTMGKIKNSTSFELRGEAGIRIYLPGYASTMDGWGGLDIGFTLAALPHFDGLTFHLRHPWYTCRSCSGDVQGSSDIFDHTKWSVTGFTINFFKFTNLEELKNKTNTFPGFSEVMTSLKNSFDISTWEQNTDFSLRVGSHLSIGLDSTRCDWDLDKNFLRQPYSGGSAIPQCGTNKCNRRAEEIVSKHNHNLNDMKDNEYTETKQFQPMVNSMYLSREGRNLQEDRSNNDDNAVRGIMSVLIEFLGKGGIIIPYCFGKCNGSDENKYIKGNITIAPPDTCDGVVLKADAKEITVANIGYLVLNEISPDIANLVSDNLGGFGKLGIKSPSITLEVTVYPKIVSTIRGSPQLPDLPSDAGFEKIIFDGLKKLIEGLTIEIQATLQSLEFAEMGFKVASKPLKINDYVSFEDSKGLGFNVYTKYKINTLPTPTSQILTFGLNIPMRVCTANCKKQPHEQDKIFLNGNINTELTIGTDAPPSLTIGGVFSMIGSWNKAFGIPIIHISNVVAGASFDISKVFPPPPSKLVLGGAVCLGSQSSCHSRKPKYFIEARMYLKLNANAPEENGFIGMVTTVTLEHMLNAAGGFHSDIQEITDWIVTKLPKDLKESGIYPFESNAAGCDKPVNNTALALGDQKMNLNCYAYVSVAPLQTVIIEEVSLEIPRGISFSGRINLFNKFDIKAKGNIDVFVPGFMKFEIDATIMNFDLGSFLEVGAEYKHGKVIGDARFYVKFKQVPLDINVYIKCAVHIPFMSTYGQVEIIIDSEKAKFDAEISVFGGIFKPYAHIEWKWDMTYFLAEFGDIMFLGGVLTVEHIKMELDFSEGSFKKAEFAAGISVLNFIKIGGSFGVEKIREATYKMDFMVYADIGIVAGSAWGTAILDTQKIENTQITDIGYKLEAPQWMKDVGKWVGQAINAIGDFLSEAFGFAADLVQAIGKELAKLGKAVLDYFKNIGEGLGRAFDAMMNGNIGEALAALADTAKKAIEGVVKAIGEVAKFLLNTLSNMAKAIAKLFGDVIRFLFKTVSNERTHYSGRSSITMTDDVVCQFRREYYYTWKTWRECWGKVVWGVHITWGCENKSTEKRKVEEDKKDWRYDQCVNNRKQQAKDVERDVEKSGQVSEAVTDTKNKNKKLLEADINNLPEKSVSHSDGKFEGTVAAGTTTMRVNVNGDARKLENNEKKTFRVTKDMQLSANDKVENSVTALEHTTAKKVSDVQAENLGNVNGLIKVVKKSGWSHHSGYKSSFKFDAVYDGQHGGICGVYSKHHNYYQDRQFKFKYCTPNMKTHRTGGRHLGLTSFDGSWEKECPGDEFITIVQSHQYDNRRKDRNFDIVCNEFDGFKKGSLCEWSNEGGWVNGWDKEFTFECPENKILTAIKSVHSNRYEDRLFSFKCCHIMKKGPVKTSDWSGYLNSFNNYLGANAGVDGQTAAFCGVSSHHNNYYEDRQFKFKSCHPRGGSFIRSSHYGLSRTNYDGHWNRECPGNRFVTNINSWHSNHRQDRVFDIYCGEFSKYSRNNDVCEWSNGGHWANEWDGDFTYACAPNTAFVAIESYHDNNREDRKFKFKCCRMQEKI